MNKNLNALLKEYYQTKNKNMLSDILYELGNSDLWVPMSIKLSPDEEVLNKNRFHLGKITTENEGYLRPGFVRSGKKLFFPIFLSQDDAPKYYSDGYTWFNITLNKAADLTLKMEEVAGIVVNAFTSPFVITREFLLYRSSKINSYEIPKGTEVLYKRLGNDKESEYIISALRGFVSNTHTTTVRKIYVTLLTKNEEKSYLIVVDAECDEYEELFRKINSYLLSHGKTIYPIDYCPCSKRMEDVLMAYQIEAVWDRS